MKIFKCSNKDCNTNEQCILISDSQSVIPSMCPFDFVEVPKPHSPMDKKADRLEPVWVSFGDIDQDKSTICLI